MAEKSLNKKEWAKLEKQLSFKKEHAWTKLSKAERKEVFSYTEDYKRFLNASKTERETVKTLTEMAQENGFVPYDKAKKSDKKLMWIFRKKVIVLAVLGKENVSKGVRIIASHIDSPRIDLKQNPLYEDLDMAYFKTHYYGGIKKYHWLSRPLALHGTILRSDGTSIDIKIGEGHGEPVFVINDLLPHLAYNIQAQKKVSEAFPAEKLNVLVGGLPLDGPKEIKNAVKLGILKLLYDQYNITEEDLISAELELVPAGSARDVGFDSAFVGGYGQDDRCSAYATFRALVSLKDAPCCSIGLFLDKEEIGSDGNTGAKARILELVLLDLLKFNKETIEPDTLLKTLFASKAISADVTAGMDPDYAEVHEKRNDALIGYGISLTKYTGSRGKYMANDAHAEYVNWMRRTWNKAGVIWQATEMGKVDEGGGGTVAKYLALHGMDIIDAGTPLLAMHSPFEIAHKVDLYMSMKAYNAFYTSREK